MFRNPPILHQLPEPLRIAGTRVGAKEVSACLIVGPISEALDEWKRLDGSVKTVLRKLLQKGLENPHIPGSELHGDLQHCYKIKLRKHGYRLVYFVEE